jgi:hypothetical protein
MIRCVEVIDGDGTLTGENANQYSRTAPSMSVLPRYWAAGAARASIARDTSTPLPFAIIGRSVQRAFGRRCRC